MTETQKTKDKDWFIKEPFLVPVGTKIIYSLNGKDFIYFANTAFMSNTKEDICVKDKYGKVYNHCSSPAWYVGFASTASISFELPSEFTVGKTVYNRNNKKFQVASEQAANKSSEYIYCNIPGEKGVYLIDKDELTFVKPVLCEKETIYRDYQTFTEVEYFPTSPTPDQFEAMVEATNLNQNEHQPNSEGGIKFDSKKVRPTLLLKSMPHAVQEVIDVLEIGARKYAPDNWKKVEVERYQDAEMRHKLSRYMGETFDPETKKYHLAHEICNLMFQLQKEIEDADSNKQLDQMKASMYAEQNQD